MKVKDLVVVLRQAANLSEGERARLLRRLSDILEKLPKNETVTKALKRRE